MNITTNTYGASGVIITDGSNPNVITGNDNVCTVTITEDANDAALFTQRINEPTLPLWLVLHAPRWFVGFCFWLKGVFK